MVASGSGTSTSSSGTTIPTNTIHYFSSSSASSSSSPASPAATAPNGSNAPLLFVDGQHQHQLNDSTTTRCTEASTLDTMPHVGLSLDEHGLIPARGLIHSILTRRLGLIVGCFMGIIVFFVLVSVLGWLKLKKRRLENAKRFHMPMPPPEYTTYRHFSIPHDEQSAVLREGMCNHLPSPAYISGAALGTTTTTSTISC